MQARVVLAIAALSQSATLFAQRPGGRPQDDNLREACRREVAGQYLALYDQSEKDRQLELYLKDKVSELQAALASAGADLAKIDSVLAKETFDTNKHAQRRALVARQESLAAALGEQQQLLDKVRGDAGKHAAQVEAFATKIKRLFVIQVLTGKGDGYKFQIAYPQPCPNYQFSCPLTSKEAAVLRQLYEPLPDACQKYADFLQW